MAYGRIRRNRHRISTMAQRPGAYEKKRSVKVNVVVRRNWSGDYSAYACIGGVNRAARRCGKHVVGRTPTKAVHAALRALIKHRR